MIISLDFYCCCMVILNVRKDIFVDLFHIIGQNIFIDADLCLI